MAKVLLWQWGRRGGGPRYTLELARALAEQKGCDVHLSLSRQSEIYEEFCALGLPAWNIDTYDSVSSALAGCARLPLIRQAFWRHVTTQSIDAVVCTMSHLWDVPVLIRRPKDVPYVLVLHDAVPHPGDDVPFRHQLLKREIMCADGVVALTEHVRGVLCHDYSYPVDRTWVIPHGVFPYASSAAVQPRVPGGCVRILFFGRILPYKGLDLLCAAFKVLKREGLNLELIVAGPGDLRPYVENLGQLDGIHIDNRWIPEGEIGSIFHHADVVVLPYKEASQSGVVATALAAGRPLVVTPIGGLVEQVKHEITGLVCDEVSVGAIASALRRMCIDHEFRLLCGANALEEVRGALSWINIARSFSEAVNRVVASHRQGKTN